MRVLHYCRTFSNLSETFIYGQITELERQGVDNHVVAHWRKNESERPFDKVSNVPWPSDWNPRRIGYRLLELIGARTNRTSYWTLVRPQFREEIARVEPNVVHAHFGRAGAAIASVAASSGVPLVTTFYGYDLSRLPKQKRWRDAYKRLFRNGARFLVEGGHMRDQLVELGCPPEKVAVQRLGVDTGDIPFTPRHRDEDEPLRVLVAGRFTEKKGMPYALRAFARFLEEGGEGTLTLVGDAGDDNDRQQREKKAILDTIEACGLQDRVRLPGLIPHEELMAAYYDHHVFLSPSVHAASGDNEGGAPVSLIEASATGTPVVSSTHCDIPEVVLHEETGLLAAERDVETLADQLLRLYHHPDLMERLGRAAHEHVREAYDAEKQGRALKEIYANVIA
jgi:colanic acid/amylovoran biosynthesis glycosyltransferase